MKRDLKTAFTWKEARKIADRMRVETHGKVAINIISAMSKLAETKCIYVGYCQ